MRAFADDGDRRTDADGPAGCCCSAASVPLAFVGVCGWRLRCLSDLWRSRQLVHNLLSTFTSTTPTLFHHEARSFLRSPLWRQRLHGPERRCEFCVRDPSGTCDSIGRSRNVSYTQVRTMSDKCLEKSRIYNRSGSPPPSSLDPCSDPEAW